MSANKEKYYPGEPLPEKMYASLKRRESFMKKDNMDRHWAIRRRQFEVLFGDDWLDVFNPEELVEYIYNLGVIDSYNGGVFDMLGKNHSEAVPDDDEEEE